MRWEAIAMWPELPSIEIRPPSAAQLAEPGRHPFGRAPLPAQEFSWIPTLGNSVHKSCSSLFQGLRLTAGRRPTWVCGAYVTPMLALVGPILSKVKLSGAHLGPRLGQVGPMWCMLGTSWAHVEPMLGLCWPMLGLCWPMLAWVGPMLGLCWRLLAPSWPMLALC